MMPKLKPGTGARPAIVPRERRPDGQPKPDLRAAKGLSPAHIKRIMDHAAAMGLDPRSTNQLGLLNMKGVLTHTEMLAGLLYADLVGQYEAIMGHPRRFAMSASLEGGRNTAPKIDLDALAKIDPDTADKIKKKINARVAKIRKDHALAQACMPGAGKKYFDRDKGEWIEGKNLDSTIVEEVCCNDRPIQSIYHPRLKACLGRLAIVVFKYKETVPHKRGDTKSQPADARILAEGAIEALENWFRKRGGTVAFFRIAPQQAWQPRKIVAYGSVTNRPEIEGTPRGASLEHEIKVPRGTLMAAAIDAQLLRAAQAKGWPERQAGAVAIEASAAAIREGINKLKQEQA